jgi:hypothetical protein
MYPFSTPGERDWMVKYMEVSLPGSRAEALVLTDTGLASVVAVDGWLAGSDAAAAIARFIRSPFICVVVADHPILAAMDAQELDLEFPAETVGRLASTLAERGGRAAFAFSSAQLASALDIVGPGGRPVLKIGRPRRGADPYVVVPVRRRWFARRLRATGEEMR